MLLRSLWLRPTVARPVRTLVTVLGVAIGVASVVATLLASRAAVASMGSDIEVVAGRARLEITRPGGVELAPLEELRPLAGEALFAPIVESFGLSLELEDIVRLLGVDLLIDQGVRALTLDFGVESENEQEAREAMLLGRGAAISTKLAGELGLEIGDELELVVRSRPVSLEVAALVEPTRFATVWERIVLVDVAFAQELLSMDGRVSRVELVPRTDADLDELAGRVERRLPEGYRVEPASTRRAEGERMVDALEFNLTALAGVSILVGIVLVATTLATAVVQRRPQIALLRSLGASRAQLARAILLEAGTIGLLGGALGVVLGWVGAIGAVQGVRATVETVVEGVLPGEIRFEPVWAVVGLTLGFLSSMVAAVLPLLEALRTPPLQGMRAEHPESVARRPWKRRALVLAALFGAAVVFANLPPLGDKPIWALLSALALLSAALVMAGPLIDLFAALRPRILRGGVGVPLRLAQAALEAGRRRAAWAAGAVGVAVGLAVAMTTMVGSFRQSVVDWTNQAMPSDLFLRPLATSSGALVGRVDPQVVRIANDVFGPETVDPFHQSRGYFRGQRVLVGGAEFSVVAGEGGVPFLDGRDSREVFRLAVETNGVVVNEPFARRFDVAAGDVIELDAGGRRIEREVTGVYRDYSGHTGRVVLHLVDYLDHYPNEGPQSVSIFLADDRPVEEARAALAAALDGRFAVELLDNREVRSEVLRVFERTFAVTIALQLISSIVAAIAVVAVLTALIHERRRELAVVRVLGGSRRQLFGLVLGEALLLGLAGALGGVIVGLLVGYVLVAVVNVQSFGWSLQFLPPSSLLWTLALVVPACLLAGLFPAVVAMRTPPRETLRAAA